MKRILMTIGLMVYGLSFAQTDQINMEKYWKFRNTFREKFIKIGSNQGESLPVGAIKPHDCVDDIDNNIDGGQVRYGEMHWGDGMIRHGHYLGLLATEYRLLKNSGQDVTGTLNELYYALSAINRLDKFGEPALGPVYSAQFPENLNGFYLREDIPEDFATNNWGTDPINARCVNSAFYQNINASKAGEIGNSYQNVPSLDQMTSLMVGFSLIHKLVDDIYIKPKTSDVGFNIVTETKAIVNRMMNFATAHNWFIIDVNGWPVANGGGDLIFGSYPLCIAAQRITGTSYFNTGFARTTLPPYGPIQHCITGFGSNNDPQQEVCDDLSYMQRQIKEMLEAQNAGTISSTNNQSVSAFQNWQILGATYSAYPSTTATLWQNLLPSDYVNEMMNLPGHPMDLFVKQYNKTIAFNLAVVSGLWNSQRVGEWAGNTYNYQLELINAVLFNTSPSSTQAFYQNFMNQMPKEGPYNLRGLRWSSVPSENVEVFKHQSGGWAAEYRWTNPTQALGIGGEKGIYNAMDYMLFHNLYKLIYQPTLTYAPTTDCGCSSSITNTLTPSQMAIDGAIAANNDLNGKLALLETCTPDVFASVFQTVSGTFNVEPKFSDYAGISIFTNDFQTSNATITPAGILNIRNRFIICNSKTLTHQNGGKINVEKGELIINPSSRLNSSGEIRIKSGTSLTIKSTGTLALLAGSKIIIEDNAKLIIDGTLEYYNGAQIITQGNNSEIQMNSLIKIMNTATFQIDHSADANSGRFIFDGIFAVEQPNTNIILKGKSRYDEFVVLKAGKQLWVPNDSDIALFRLDDCKMELLQGSSIKAEQPFRSAGVDYIGVNHHLGITLTEESMFLNCNFKDISIQGMLYAENKGKLNLSNCTFSRINPSLTVGGTEYVFVNGMGYTAQNCTFTNPQLYGIRSYNMTLPSTVSGCTFTQNATTGLGLKDVSSTELIVNSSTFTYLSRAIYKDNGKLSLKCNTFQYNKGENLYITNGCLLNMTTSDYAGYNFLYRTTDNKNVVVSAAIVSIANGYNYIDDNCQYVFQGTLAHLCIPGFPCALLAKNNQWNAGNTAPVASKFNLTLSSNGSSYSTTTTPVAYKPTCGFYDAPNPQEPGNPNGKSLLGQDTDGMPYIEMSSNDSIRLDDAVLYGMNVMELNDSLGDDLEAIETFDAVFSSELSKSDSVSRYWLDFTLHHMKSAVENAFSTGKLTRAGNANAFNKYVGKYAKALMYMTDSIIDEYNYTAQYYHEMNKAHLYRLIGHPDLGMNILTALENCGLDSAEQQHLNYWKTQFAVDLVAEEIGQAILDTVIIIDTTGYLPALPLQLNEYYFGARINTLFDIEYPNCGYYTTDKMLKEESTPEFALFPNPADDIVNIVLNHSMAAGTSSTLVFQATDGKVVYNTSFTETENSVRTINVSAWKTGVYLYKYTIASGKTYMGKLVVR